MATSDPPTAGNTASEKRSAPLAVLTRHLSRGTCIRTTGKLTTAELQTAREETAKHLRELYDQGVPFFSKEVMRLVLDQIESSLANSSPPSDADQDGPIISIPALNGAVVRYPLETGSVRPVYKGMKLPENTEWVVGEPYLGYQTLSHLTRKGDMFLFRHDQGYSPIHLVYPLKLRDATTKEYLVPSDCASVDQLQATFDAGVKAWEASEDCKKLRSLFERVTPLPKISNIVAFACSTMSGLDKERPRIVYQHALILTLRDIFSRRRGEGEPEIRCFAQDPAYTDTDKEVLKRAGVTVLGDPRGFLEVDDESVVISFSPNIPVRQIVADIARPAVLAINHVKTEAEVAEFWGRRDFDPGSVCDPESSRVRDMVRDHYHEPVTFGPRDVFGDASVYIRRVKEDGSHL